ncbi:ArsC/Spx/MgsR family protein [Aerococcus christensenii]|uniref:ArsC/Spx/MgsR family protein n=1 Tax=Aerococcus christensenii TaxID=87541 RepID=UPI0023A92200|nr:ArsC/Spx/MgsR family protein [Aerococcus christensenii]WEB70478.1 arsenate reductase family protein [Aerococcus christensenii]
MQPLITLYGIKRCSTSSKGEKALKEAGIPYEFVDIRTISPSVEALRQALGRVDKIKKIVNTSGQIYRKEHLKDKLDQMSEGEVLDLLHQEGRLVKRPFITDGTMSTAGASEENLKFWIERGH